MDPRGDPGQEVGSEIIRRSDGEVWDEVSFNLGTASGRIQIDGSAAQKGFAVAQAGAQGFFNVIDSKVQSVKRLGQAMAVVGTVGSAGLALAVKSASSFQKELSGIEAVSGATAQQMDAIRAMALKLGADTSFSANEAAQAISELVKAGLSVEDTLNGAAEATVNLAAAGEIDLPQAAEIAAAAMNQFGLAAEDMPNVADKIAGAANASAIEVSDFGDSMRYAGGVANLAGLSFDDMAVAIAQMGQKGYKGSQAGTSLQAMLLRLQPETEAQSAQFEKMGLSTFNAQKAMEVLASNGIAPLSSEQSVLQDQLKGLAADMSGSAVGSQEANEALNELTSTTGIMQNQFYDTEGNLKSFGEIQGLLSESTKDMTKEQKTAALSLLFGDRAIKAAAVSAEEGAEGFNNMAEAMGKVKAADVAATRLDNLEGSIEEFRGSIETAMITIGSVFLPIITKIVDAATFLINIFNALPGPIQVLLSVVLGLGAVLTMLAGILLTVLTVLGPVIIKWALMKVVLMAVIGPIKAAGLALLKTKSITVAASAANAAYAATLGRVTFAMVLFQRLSKGMAAAWAIAAAPLTAITAVVAAVIAVVLAAGIAFYFLYTQVEAFRNVINDVIRTMIGVFMPSIQALVDIVKGALTDAWKVITDAWNNEVYPALLGVGEALNGTLLPALRQIVGAIGPVVVGFMKFVAILMGGFLVALVRVGAFIVQYFTAPLLKLYATIISKVMVAFAAIVNFITGKVVPALRAIASFITGTLIAAWNKISSTVRSVFGPALQAASEAINGKIIPALQKLWQNLRTIWEVISGAFSTAISKLKDAFSQIWASLQSDLIPALRDLWISLEPIVGAIAKVVGAIVGGLLMALVSLASFILGTIVPAIISFAADALVLAIESVTRFAGMILGVLIPALQAFLDFLPGTSSAADNLGNSAADLQGKMDSLAGGANDTADALGDTGDSASDAAGGLDEYEQQAKEAEAAQNSLNSAMRAMSALKAGQSVTDWKEAMANLKAQIRETTTSFNDNTKESRANATAVRSMAGSAREHANALIQEADGTGQVTEVTERANQAYSNRVAALLATIPPTAANKSIIDELTQSMNGIPATKTTTVTAPGAGNAKAQIKALATQMGITPKELTAQIRALGANASKAEIASLAKQMQITPKQLRILMKSVGGDAASADIKKPSKAAQDAAKTMPPAGKAAGAGFSAGLKVGGSKAGAIGGQIGKSAVQGAKSGAPSDALIGTGSSLMSGFLSGINSLASSVIGAAQSIASSVKSTIESALQIRSPSRWAHGVGVFMMQGLAGGISDGSPLVDEQVQGVLNNIYANFRKDRLPEKFKKTKNKAKDKANAKKAAKNAKKNAKEEKRLSKIALKAMNKGQLNQLNNLNAQVGRPDNSFLTLNEQLRDAKSALDSAQQAYNEYSKSVSAGVRSTGDIVNMWASQTGSGMIPTFKSLADALQTSVDNASAFDVALKKINDAGLDPAIIQQLVEAGVGSAGQVAALIATMSPEEISKLNALQGKLNTVSDSIGKFAADKFYAAGVQAAQGLVNGLTSQINSIMATITNLTNALAAQITAAIGAGERAPKPSKGKGKDKGKGKGKGKKKAKKRAMGGNFTRGHDYWTGETGPELITSAANGRVFSNNSVMRDLQRAYSSLKPMVAMMAAVDKTGAAIRPAASSQQNVKNVNVEVNNYNPIAEPSSVTTKNVMTRLAVIGV